MTAASTQTTMKHAPRPDDDIPILDAHHHLWDLEGQLRYPWLTNNEHAYMGENSALRRTYLPPEFKRDCALHNVIGTVHVEAECDRSMQVAETRWLTKIAAEHGMPNAIVAHAWIDEPNSDEILSEHKKFPLVRGIRTKPIIATGPGDTSVRGKPRSMQDPKWRKGLALLEKHDLSWDLRVPFWHLEEAAEVVREHPKLRIVLNHHGYAFDRTPEGLAIWRRGMERLAACPNVWCKISALNIATQPWTLAANKPLILDTISMFGADRCMFASNFPVDGLKGSWDYIYSQFKLAVAHLPLADRHKLFADNAIAFYRPALPARG